MYNSSIHVECSKNIGQDCYILQGVGPTAQRAAIVVGVELPAYDMIKRYLLKNEILGDTKSNHFV